MSSFNWQQSLAHLVFLATFFKARNPNDPSPGNVDWKLLLGEEPKQAVDRFIRDGAIRAPSLHQLLDHRYKAPELKEMCRKRDLQVSGTKDELITRLRQTDPIGMEVAVAGFDLYEVTDWGRKLAEEHLAKPEQTRQFTEAMPQEPEKQAELKKAMRWILLEGIVLGVAGNLVYDLLKEMFLSLLVPDEAIPPELIPQPTPAPAPAPLGGRVKIEWCHVPAGYFLMGSADTDPDAFDNEKPQHRVYLTGYWISKYPITNVQYRQFVQATGHHQPSHWEKGFPQEKHDHPVVWVYWSDAVAFCQWATGRIGQTVRLPSEAEWEKAAWGTDGRIYPWGDRWQTGRCNNVADGVKDTTPVGQYPSGASPYGVHDMSGNVWEWTSTVWDGKFTYPYRADDGRESPDSVGKRHILRGSSWVNEAEYVRAAFRFHLRLPWDVNGGFRAVVSAPFSPAYAL